MIWHALSLDFLVILSVVTVSETLKGKLDTWVFCNDLSIDISVLVITITIKIIIQIAGIMITIR